MCWFIPSFKKINLHTFKKNCYACNLFVYYKYIFHSACKPTLAFIKTSYLSLVKSIWLRMPCNVRNISVRPVLSEFFYDISNYVLCQWTLKKWYEDWYNKMLMKYMKKMEVNQKGWNWQRNKERRDWVSKIKKTPQQFSIKQ